MTTVFRSFALGTVLRLLAGGALSDRAGERWAIAGGLGAGRRDERIEPFRLLAGAARVLLLVAAALSGAPDAIAVPVLMAGGVAAMSWNGLSFTAAAEISGRRQGGTAMGIQNTAMRLVAVAVPVGLGALLLGLVAARLPADGRTPLVARRVLGPLVAEEHERRAARRARLAEAQV